MNQHRYYSQVLIIGGGIAGVTTALVLADAGFEITLIVPSKELDGGNSQLAQGGIVFHSQDDNKQLENDILNAGHQHNYLKAVRFLCKKGPEVVHRLLIERIGIPFEIDKQKGTWSVTREGGHSSARIIHCADHTGKSIMEGLLKEIQKTSNIQILTHRTAIDLITTHHHAKLKEYRYNPENQCLGAYVFNEQTNEVETLLADWTVLATGGIGQIYLHTTNTEASIGSGIAMAHRASVKLTDLEYIQFHPTALYSCNKTQKFLITEALRGEGAKLTNTQGKAFMKKYDTRAELAPRDIVARAIMEELLHTGEQCVYLDLSNVSHDITKRFPTIYNYCYQQGLSIKNSPIPVVPAAHYFCGGILTDTQGQTSLSRLFAVGECSCTGVHGANRLASTSLLEGLLWGYSTGLHISRKKNKKNFLSTRIINAIPNWECTGNEKNDDPALITQDWTSIRHIMWNYVGICRTGSRLKRAFEELRDLSRHLHDFYKNTPISKPIIDLFHGSQAAYIITQKALLNTKSIGCHYRIN